MFKLLTPLSVLISLKGSCKPLAYVLVHVVKICVSYVFINIIFIFTFAWNAKSFAIDILIFLLVVFFAQTGKSYFQIFLQLLLLARVTWIGVINMICRMFLSHVL